MLKIFEMFSGFGGASFALKKLEIPFKIVGCSEIDKYAIKCYEQNHQETYYGKLIKDCRFKYNPSPKNYGDCTKINPDELPDFDLLTGGFPCQSFSVAGKGLGEQDTRGTLFHEIIRIAEIKKPKYMLLENVKGLTFKPHKKTFEKIVSEIKRIGYYVHIQVLNSKDYGIPQNRERVFFVCYRQDISGFDDFEFPEKEELKIFLKDILEKEVDEKYYLSDKKIYRIKQGRIDPKIAHTLTGGGHSGGNHSDMDAVSNELINKNKNYYMSGKIYKNGDCGNANRIFKPEGVCQTIQSNTRTKIIQLNQPKHSNNRVYSSEGISPTINTMGGGNRQPFVQYINTKNADNKQPPQQDRIYNENGVMTSISSQLNGRFNILNQGNIRRLTPTECFRLMGFNDEINLEGLSNTQRYKLAGNGFDINLVSKILIEMFK